MTYLPTIKTVNGTLTSAQIKALHGTPITAVSSPGSGFVIQIISATASFVYGGTNVFVAAAAQTIAIYYGTTTQALSVLSNGSIIGTANVLTASGSPIINNSSTASYANLSMTLYNPVATEISGNAANDNVIKWSISYRVVPA